MTPTDPNAPAMPQPLANTAPDWVELNDNGAWSWFMDERAVVHAGKLVVGSVRSTDRGMTEGRGLPGWGNIELTVHDLATGRTRVVVLHEQLQQDDHNGPALHALADDRLLAVYTKHAVERKVYWRVSEPNDPLTWGPVREFESPGQDAGYAGDNVTYSNLFQPASEGGRLYNFFRSLGHQQSYMVSDDQAESWRYAGRFLCGHSGYAPYFKYTTDHQDTIYFVGTEDHPREFDNSVYAGFIRGGRIHQSDGVPYAPLSTTETKSGDIWDLTCVFRGDPDNVAWVSDLHLDRDGHPVCVFSVQKDGRGLPPKQGGFDHRFHYARFDGTRWHQHEVCFAGTRLYPFEDDYTGLITLDPQDTDVVFVSTDAHPQTGEPLVSAADGERHRELFRGVTRDGGESWAWQPVTRDSDADNLRPIVPVWDDPRTALVWMRGTYQHNTGPWDTRVVALIREW